MNEQERAEVVLPQEAFDTLMDLATRYAMIVSDGNVAKMHAVLIAYGGRMSDQTRKMVALHIVQHGPEPEELDADGWRRVLVALQPKPKRRD